MLSILKTTLRCLPPILPQLLNQRAAMIHAIVKPNILSNNNTIIETIGAKFLVPFTPSLTPACGFKVKGRLRRRCKDCYFVRREERLYVICKTHPRHKQMSMVPKEKNTWILTHATQGKIRPW